MIQQTLDFTVQKFDGAAYDESLDGKRLQKQIYRIFDLMRDGKFTSLRDIEDITGYGQSSISAQLRNLKKKTFGSHGLEKRRRTVGGGTWEYRLIVGKV
jgi:hypothetical protein